MFKKNRAPMLVVVRDGQYNCFGLPTARNVFLMETLKRQGGIADSVPDGRYHYNVRRRGFKYIATLNPAE